jgi:hypothetical protein
MKQWTAAAADCLDIEGMGNIATIEADDLKLGRCGPDSDSDSDSVDRACKSCVFFIYFLGGGLCHDYF